MPVEHIQTSCSYVIDLALTDLPFLMPPSLNFLWPLTITIPLPTTMTSTFINKAYGWHHVALGYFLYLFYFGLRFHLCCHERPYFVICGYVLFHSYACTIVSLSLFDASVFFLLCTKWTDTGHFWITVSHKSQFAFPCRQNMPWWYHFAFEKMTWGHLKEP